MRSVSKFQKRLGINVHLIECKKALDKRVKMLDEHFHRDVLDRGSRRILHRCTIGEGIVSSLWQSWCYFCRSIVLSSAAGTMTKGGGVVSSPYAHLNERQLITLSLKFCRGERIPPSIQMANGWVDLAWGDVEKLNLIINGMSTSNKDNLLSSFGAANHLKVLQKSRNACAHICTYTIEQIKNMRVFYNDNFFIHPSEIMFWTDPVSGRFLWKEWINEIDLISSLVIE